MASAFNQHYSTTTLNEAPVDLTFYNILNVPPTATASEIKKSYYALSLQYHPDRTQDLNESVRAEFAEHFKAISQAYSELIVLCCMIVVRQRESTSSNTQRS